MKIQTQEPLLIFRKQNELSLIKNETLLMIMATNHIDLIIKMRIQQLLNNCVEFQLYVPKSRLFSYLWNINTDWMSARHEYRIKWGTFSYATEFKAQKRKNKEHFFWQMRRKNGKLLKGQHLKNDLERILCLVIKANFRDRRCWWKNFGICWRFSILKRNTCLYLSN